MLIIVDLLDPGLIPSATLEKRRIFWNTSLSIPTQWHEAVAFCSIPRVLPFLN